MAKRVSQCGLLLCAMLLGAMPERVHAFCGFYVAGADTSLYANATMVVLMRQGTRTVLSMQNNYQGPPEKFALVIPVPSVLKQDQVKVLPKAVFEKVDALGAPRLVEYWEMDPCRQLFTEDRANFQPTSAAATTPGAESSHVKVEAQFAVGEYDVVILSADDSSALDGWLRANDYNIPQGAAPILAPYIAGGMKFFVAKVDPARVTFENGQAALSPLRFHYDTPEFSLPVRLGLLNSQGKQDLIINILAQQRYELANYLNATIPTNIRVQDDVRNSFASFYEALFARTLQKNPGAVVTEYAWSAASCDPCPTPPLGPSELATLGEDVLSSDTQGPGSIAYGFTLTRLHARYTKESLGEDLIFKAAPPIVGGRGIPDEKGELSQKLETQQQGVDNFQGRYVILHAWDGVMLCRNPQRGSWGGPPDDKTPSGTQSAPNMALRGKPAAAGDLPALVAETVTALDVKASHPRDPLERGSSGCAALAAPGGTAWFALAGLCAAGVVALIRRRKSRS
ncbi:MAG TPA: DUF2330 domain-containing protein [Polyangiales bacterium]|nr:DUF2330 domain-containing protein [Polyangiales bacterium]